MKHFIENLLSQPHGQIIVCNILDGHKEGLYDADFIRQLLKLWKDMHLFRSNAYHVTYDQMLLELESLVLRERLPPGFSHAGFHRDFRLNCDREIRHEDYTKELTTVVAASTFGKIIDESDRRVLLGKLGSIDLSKPKWSDDEIEVLMNLPAAYRKIRLKDGAAIGLHPRVFWYTIKSEFETALLKNSNKAEQARDALGLIHRKPQDVLFALHIPAHIIDNVKNGRPTFADAGAHRRFKTSADAPVNKKRTEWGHTADLGQIICGHNCLDGLPERISVPLDNKNMGKTTKIEFTPLGIVTTERGKSKNDNDEYFARRIRNGRSKSKLIKEMMAIL